MKRTVRDDYTVPDSPEQGGDTRELIGNRLINCSMDPVEAKQKIL